MRKQTILRELKDCVQKEDRAIAMENQQLQCDVNLGCQQLNQPIPPVSPDNKSSSPEHTPSTIGKQHVILQTKLNLKSKKI